MIAAIPPTPPGAKPFGLMKMCADSALANANTRERTRSFETYVAWFLSIVIFFISSPHGNYSFRYVYPKIRISKIKVKRFEKVNHWQKNNHTSVSF